MCQNVRPISGIARSARRNSHPTIIRKSAPVGPISFAEMKQSQDIRFARFMAARHRLVGFTAWGVHR